MTPIPSTLEEAVDSLLYGMTLAQRADYAREPEDSPGVSYHHGFGTSLRNDWGLWHGETALSQWFRAHRLFHGDDISATIFKALWRKLHGLSIGSAWLAKEAVAYETFWRETAGLTWDMQPIPGREAPKSLTIRVDSVTGETKVDL